MRYSLGREITTAAIDDEKIKEQALRGRKLMGYACDKSWDQGSST